jgi:hypothetical protein
MDVRGTEETEEYNLHYLKFLIVTVDLLNIMVYKNISTMMNKDLL